MGMCLLLLCLLGACAQKKGLPDNEILYTSVSGRIVEPDSLMFDAIIIENTYVDGVGRIRFNQKLTEIKAEAFYERTDLKTVRIPASVHSIGGGAFALCGALDSVEFAEDAQLQRIGRTAFAATALRHFTVPASVGELGGAVLASCNALESIEGPFSGNVNRALIYRNTLNSVAPAGLTTFVLEEQVEAIGELSFYGIEHIEDVYLPVSVRGVGVNAFCKCPDLKAIYFTAPRAPLLGGGCFDVGTGLILYVPEEHHYGGHSNWYLYNKNGYVKGYATDDGNGV